MKKKFTVDHYRGVEVVTRLGYTGYLTTIHNGPFDGMEFVGKNPRAQHKSACRLAGVPCKGVFRWTRESPGSMIHA